MSFFPCLGDTLITRLLGAKTIVPTAIKRLGIHPHVNTDGVYIVSIFLYTDKKHYGICFRSVSKHSIRALHIGIGTYYLSKRTALNEINGFRVIVKLIIIIIIKKKMYNNKKKNLRRRIFPLRTRTRGPIGGPAEIKGSNARLINWLFMAW